MQYEVMASTSQHVVIEGLPLLVNDFEHTDPPTFWAQQVDIIMALQERVYNSPLGVSRYEDLV